MYYIKYKGWFIMTDKLQNEVEELPIEELSVEENAFEDLSDFINNETPSTFFVYFFQAVI